MKIRFEMLKAKQLKKLSINYALIGNEIYKTKNFWMNVFLTTEKTAVKSHI